MDRIFTGIGLFLMLISGVAACIGGEDTSSTPLPNPGTRGVVVTFDIEGREQYRILLTDPVDIEIARKLLAGEEAPSIPNGLVVRGDASVNDGYSWHIDPASVEFADMTIEVCDGMPSDVEQELITSDRYCPWGATVIAIDEYQG